MRKINIVEEVAKATDLSKKEASLVVEKIIEAFKNALREGKKIEIRDFGVFMVKQRAKKIGRNPKTNIEVPIEARKVPVFKGGKELKRIINEPLGPEETEGIEQPSVMPQATPQQPDQY